MFANDEFLHISQQALRKGWKESLSRCCYLHSITLPSGDKEIITFKVLGSFSMDWKGEEFLCAYSQEPMTAH